MVKLNSIASVGAPLGTRNGSTILTNLLHSPSDLRPHPYTGSRNTTCLVQLALKLFSTVSNHPLHHLDYKERLYRCNTSLELLGRSNLKFFLRPHFYIPLQLVQLRRVHVLHDSQWQVSVLIQWGDASHETRRDELASPREGYTRLQIPTRPGPP